MERRQCIFRVALLLTVFFWVATPIFADARAGGGSHGSVSRSSGGSSRSSSGSSRSSGGGGGGFFFFGGGSGGSSGSGGSGGDVLVLIILLIVICLAIWFVLRWRRNRAAQDTGQGVLIDDLPPPTRADEIARWNQSDGEIQERLAAIKAHDPAFDEGHFIDRVQTACLILNNAWVKGDLTPALPFLSEGEASRLTMQLEGDRNLNRRNVMEDLVVSGVRIVHVDQNGDRDVIVSRIDASATDYYIDTRTGKDIDGWHHPRPFTEYWTFARASTAHTTAKSYMEHACPNCGAPLELGNISVCQFCGTPVASAEYDWVLMTIDQKYTNE